jgi:Lysylphosphatidylglycerol synthase TM region
VVVSLPWAARRRAGPSAPRLSCVIAGIREAERTAANPSLRLLGVLGYLGFDIAVLWATLSAVGHVPPVPALVLGYMIGYLANAVPIPGGLGVLDAGLTGALVLYGVSPAHAAAAVLVYHAIAFWVPALGGVIAYAYLRPRLIEDANRSVGDIPPGRAFISIPKGGSSEHPQRPNELSLSGFQPPHATPHEAAVPARSRSPGRRRRCERVARPNPQASEPAPGVCAGYGSRAP